MKNIILISPNMMVDIDYVGKDKSRFIPEGLLYLCTALMKEGYNVKICDMAKDDLDCSGADIFGITGLPNQFPQIRDTIALIRTMRPKAKIILGGPFMTCASLWLENLLDYDIAVKGEGERQIVSSVRAVLSTNKEKRSLETASPIKSQDFILPALELIDIVWYLGGEARLFNYPLARPTINNLMLSRGCPRKCSFCRQPFGPKVRCMPKYNIGRILDTYAKSGAKSVRFQDDNWIYLEPGMRKYVLEKLRELGLEAAFNCRVDDLSDEFLREISGYKVVKQIAFGVETLSQCSLDCMNKGTTASQIRRAVERTRKYGIDPAFFIMVGVPHENQESVNETLTLIETEMVFPLFTFFLPIPGTIYWDDFTKTHDPRQAFELFESWDSKQVSHGKVFFNITKLRDAELIEYYLLLKQLQDKFR